MSEAYTAPPFDQVAPTQDVRVLIVDDHRLFADLLEFALGCEPGLTLVGSATGAADAVEEFRSTRPDVVVMDLQLGPGGTEGIDVTRAILEIDPDAKVLVLTALKEHHLALAAAAAGAAGFLQKDGSARAVIHALRAVHAGYLLIAPTVLAELGRLVPGSPSAPPQLTDRESDVLHLMGQGQTTRTIARRLGLSPQTVRSHTQAIMGKLGTHTQLETVVKASRLRLIPPAGTDVEP